MTIIATAKALSSGGSCCRRTCVSAPILLLALLLSACAHPHKAVAPVVVNPVVKEQAVVQEQPAVESQPAVTEEQPPVQLPAIPPPKRRDHNIEED